MARRAPFAGSSWPSSEQELLLRAALLEDARGAAAWEELRPHLDIERLERGSLGLLPLLYERLLARGVDESVLPRLKGVFRYTWSRSQLAFDQLASMLSILDRHAIESVVLGDAALISQYYRRLGVRALDELAVLVHPSNVGSAVDAFVDAGWTPVSRSGGHVALDASPAPLALRRAVYWRTLVEQEASVASCGRWWEARRGTVVQELATAALSPTHELLRVCIGGARTGSTAIWVADASTVIRTAGNEVDWDELVNEAVRLHMALRLRDALSYLSDAVSAPVPAAVTERLARLDPSRRERLAHRIGSRGGRLLGTLPASVAAHIVATEHRSPMRTVFMLPAFVRTEWGLSHLRDLPMATVRRARSALSAARSNRRETHD